MTLSNVIIVGSSPWHGDARDNVSYRYFEEIARQTNTEFHVVVPPDRDQSSGQTRAGNVVLHRVTHRGNGHYVLSASRLIRSVARETGRSSIVLSSDPVGLVVGTILSRRFRHVFQLQGEVVHPGPAYGPRLRRLILGLVVRSGMRRCDAVRAVNDALADQARATTRADVYTIGTRVDTSMFRPIETHERTGVAVVSSLISLKNVSTLISAWSQVPNELREQGLHIYGDGPQKANLEEQSRSLRVSKTVHFHGRVPNTAIARLLPTHRCFVSASFTEGQPRAVLEGFACGLPALLSDIPAHRNLGDVPSEICTLIEPADVSSWATNIARMLNWDQGALGEASATASSFANRNFGLAENAAKMSRLIQAVMNTASERR